MLQSNFPENSTSLTPSSSQFARIEYLLQLSLKASTARLTEASVISNPHQTLQFEKRNQQSLVLDSWVEASDLAGSHNDANLVKNLESSSFSLPKNGMKFSVGQIPLENVSQDRDSTRIVKRMVLCKIGVGRSYVYDTDKAIKESIPQGYDSFYLMAYEDGQKSKPKDVEYYHEYWIKNTNQVLPVAYVTFEYDPMVEKLSREKPICDNCEKTFATVYCSADMANLCSDCDINVHNTKILQRHKRTPIGKGADVFGLCRIHTDQKIEFFCAQCHLPVCVHCKMVGHHSAGEASKHKLVSVVEAFDTVTKESKIRDQVLVNRRSTIQKQVSVIHQRAKQVENMKAQLEAEIERVYKLALNSLNYHIQSKLLVLLGDEIELKRQDQEIDSLEKFLEYQQSSADMYHLLFNWSKHQQIRQELHDFRHFRDAVDVDLDLKVSGDLIVSVDKASKLSSSPVKMEPKKLNYKAKDLTSNVSMVSSAPRKKPFMHRRTSDIFAETLNALDDMTVERSAIVNEVNEDERSCAGYDFKF